MWEDFANPAPRSVSLLSMSLERCLDNHRTCLAAAEQLLGETPRAVELSWEYEQLLRPHLRFERRRGVRDEDPILAFESGRPGHRLAAGLERYRLVCDDCQLPIVRVCLPTAECLESTWVEFWAVGQSGYRELYRVLRRLDRRSAEAAAPLMPPGETQRLYANTIGFLRHGSRLLRDYGVPQRRGVLMLGTPGNGKTMACRWIRAQCQRRGLAARSISAEEFRAAMAEGQAHAMFELAQPGVIFFDDFDSALRDRDLDGSSTERTLFLGGLDGLHAHHGVVYIFTSNARIEEIDPAIRRPGRLDVILTFQPPSAAMRRQLIADRWHPDLRRQILTERVVQETEGLSFAELEEVKKLLVLQHLESGHCDWTQASREFHEGRGASRSQAIVGFAAPAARRCESSLPQTAACGPTAEHPQGDAAG